MEYTQGYQVGIRKKELKEKGFPVYRQSNIKNYYKCPMMFHLSQTLDPKVVSQLIESKATNMGLLFEGYVLGFKDDIEEEGIKGIGTKVKDRLKSSAEYLRHYSMKDILQFGAEIELKDFIKDCELYYDQLVVGKTLALSGEADFFHPEFGFFDIKHSENLDGAGWTHTTSRYDRLQCIVYPYMKYIGEGKIHPFYYIIVESNDEDPVVRVMKYKPTLDDFKWFENEIKTIHADPFYAPYTGDYNENCLKQRYGLGRGRCKFIKKCSEGQKVLGGFHEIQFMEGHS